MAEPRDMHGSIEEAARLCLEWARHDLATDDERRECLESAAKLRTLAGEARAERAAALRRMLAP